MCFLCTSTRKKNMYHNKLESSTGIKSIYNYKSQYLDEVKLNLYFSAITAQKAKPCFAKLSLKTIQLICSLCANIILNIIH